MLTAGLTTCSCHLPPYSVFRAFQGALSSGIGTLAYIILSDLVPLTERGKYQAIIDIIVSFSSRICTASICANPVALRVTIVHHGPSWSKLAPPATVVLEQPQIW